MLIQSRPGRHLRSRPATRLHSRTDLTALAIFRLSASSIQGITVHSASSHLDPTIVSGSYLDGTGFDQVCSVAIDST